jgi:hypothetical protein
MRGEDFITLAGFLAALQRSDVYEACCRSAISRAYYGCYHTTKAFLEEVGLVVGEAHPDLAKDFLDSQQDDLMLIGGLLNELRKRRNVADYELERTMGFKDAEHGLGSAHQIIGKLASLRWLVQHDEKRQQLVRAILEARKSRPPRR